MAYRSSAARGLEAVTSDVSTFRGDPVSFTPATLVWFAECGFPQASRITLTKSCRLDNSLGDDFAHHVRLTGVLKLLEGSLESLTHCRNRLRIERSRLHEWTNWHGRPCLQQGGDSTVKNSICHKTVIKGLRDPVVFSC